MPAAVDDLVAEADASLERAAEAGGEKPDEDVLSQERSDELFRLFDEVRLRTFLAYPDPRSNFEALTMEAFTRAYLDLPADASDEKAYERIMDEAMQLAANDRAYFAERRGRPALYIPSLVDLFGFKAGEEFHSWLTEVDNLKIAPRAAFHLRAMYEMTNRKASKVLGCSEGWTSKLYSRAELHLTSAGVPVEELKKGFFDVEFKRR
ncbi:hypothetical protein AB0C70_42180 [Streptomyces sp. NPDC048564]|uniref:hypothetical protein n=1 Tax=Streptomyces sp. NPDC048564 TaxID=3155760 RepID=UPI00342B5728